MSESRRSQEAILGIFNSWQEFAAFLGIIGIACCGALAYWDLRTKVTSLSEMHDPDKGFPKHDNPHFHPLLDVLPGKVTHLEDSLEKRTEFEPPIGTILAWHKNPNPGDPTRQLGQLPPGVWLECDGQPLPDGSPLRDTGATRTPILNAAKCCEQGRFLRGGTTSGKPQDPSAVWFGLRENQGAFYYPRAVDHFILEGDGIANEEYRKAKDKNKNTKQVDAGKTSIQLKSKNLADETPAFTKGNEEWVQVRPVNMSVVWIMRVK